MFRALRDLADLRGRVVWLLTTVGLFALVVGLGLQLTSQRRFAVREVEQRFHDRAALAADYVSAHVGEMRHRLVEYARLELTEDEVPAEAFDSVPVALGFESAVLVDESGSVEAVSPRRPAMLGRPIAGGQPHLALALDGTPAVSDVFVSEVDQEPIVAVAAPFDTPSGRRVLSAAYRQADTPLGPFLASMSSLRGREVYLLDADDEVIASSETIANARLDHHAPELAAVVADGAHAADVEYGGEVYRYVARPVDGTPWRLVAVAPRAQVLSSIGYQYSGARVLFAATLVMAIAVAGLLRHVLRQRHRLDHLSRTDALTGLANRGQADLLVARAAAMSERTSRPWAVAVIDVDHFKQVNDRLGHAAGDRVLRHLATVLRQQTRTSDEITRWGGEEFLLVMEDTDTIAAVTAAERILAAVREGVSVGGKPVTVSVGVAAGTGIPAETMVADADGALYRAKANGRDRVEMALPTDIEGLIDDLGATPA